MGNPLSGVLAPLLQEFFKSGLLKYILHHIFQKYRRCTYFLLQNIKIEKIAEKTKPLYLGKESNDTISSWIS